MTGVSGESIPSAAAAGDQEPRRRFPIRFDGWYAKLSRVLLLPPTTACVRLDAGEVEVRMGWAFRARFPRESVRSAEETPLSPLSRGVHGFSGRWLVNGSCRGLLAIELQPTQRAFVVGFPVRVRLLFVSVTEPSELARALRRGAAASD